MSNHNENMLDQLKKYFDETPREQVEKDWGHVKENAPKCGPTVNEFLANGGRISFDEDIESFDRDIDRHPLDDGYDPNFDPDYFVGDERDLDDPNDEGESFEETIYEKGFQDGIVSTEAKNYWFEKFEYQKQTKI